jgi:hypothetical protein
MLLCTAPSSGETYCNRDRSSLRAILSFIVERERDYMRRFPQKYRSRAVMLQEEGEFGLPPVWKSGGAEECDSVKQGHLVKAE